MRIVCSVAPLAGSAPSIPSISEATSESVVAGLASPDMARLGSMGYGIHLTDRRVIGLSLEAPNLWRR